MTIAPYMMQKVQTAGQKAIEENLAMVDLQDGLLLVKADSLEGRERLKKEGIVAQKVKVDNVDFLLCNS